MKKTKFLALAIIVAMALVGAGFAYWTDQLNISGTVETGNLEVVYSDLNYEFSSGYLAVGDNSGYTDKDLDIHVVDMYPGSKATVKFKVTNNGTVPAVLENLWLNNPGFINSNLKLGKVDYLHIEGRVPRLPGPLPGFGGESIEPGETKEFEIELSIPYSVIPCNESQEQEVGFTMQMNWKQYDPR